MMSQIMPIVQQQDSNIIKAIIGWNLSQAIAIVSIVNGMAIRIAAQ